MVILTIYMDPQNGKYYWKTYTSFMGSYNSDHIWKDGIYKFIEY